MKGVRENLEGSLPTWTVHATYLSAKILKSCGISRGPQNRLFKKDGDYQNQKSAPLEENQTVLAPFISPSTKVHPMIDDKNRNLPPS